jgi:transposase
VQDPERMLSKKTMQAEILKEAIDLARLRKQTSPLLSWSYPENDIR